MALVGTSRIKKALPIVLVGVVSFVAPVVGAFCGIFIAEERFTNNYLPSTENLEFAFAWGATGGVLSALVMSLYAAGQAKILSQLLVLALVWISVAILSGFSLYAFVVHTGSI